MRSPLNTKFPSFEDSWSWKREVMSKQPSSSNTRVRLCLLCFGRLAWQKFGWNLRIEIARSKLFWNSFLNILLCPIITSWYSLPIVEARLTSIGFISDCIVSSIMLLQLVLNPLEAYLMLTFRDLFPYPFDENCWFNSNDFYVFHISNLQEKVSSTVCLSLALLQLMFEPLSFES